MRQVVEHVTASNRTARNGWPQTRQNLDFIVICYTWNGSRDLREMIEQRGKARARRKG
jgi:hypothetical protein